MKMIRYAGILLILVVTSCLMVTVNVYFPEKDVQQAFKSLEKELMAAPDKKQESEKKQERAPAPESAPKPAGKPTSLFKISIVTEAFAQEPILTDRISDFMRKMPEVVEAYREMGARVREIDRLRDAGAVGEGNDGLLSTILSLTQADKDYVDKENQNRKTVMYGMARAVIRLNMLKETHENVKKAIPQAVEQFVRLRREAARKGWWIQDETGRWTRK